MQRKRKDVTIKEKETHTQGTVENYEGDGKTEDRIFFFLFALFLQYTTYDTATET